MSKQFHLAQRASCRGAKGHWPIIRAVRTAVGVVCIGGCSAAGPVVPDVAAGEGQIAGVVHFDDGDGVFGDGDALAPMVETRLGIATQTLQPDSSVLTGEGGGFAHDIPLDMAAQASDLFVQATIEVDGPIGQPVNLQFRQRMPMRRDTLVVQHRFRW